MKRWLWGISIFIAVFWLISTIVTLSVKIESSNTDYWLYRAQAAGNPQQVSEYLTNYKDGLYSHNLVNDKYYSVFKYPATYMPTYINVIDGLIQRANDLSKQSPNETSFQMGLTNLETDLSDITAEAFEVWCSSFLGCVLSWCAMLGWLLAIVIAFIAMIIDDRDYY